MSENSSTLEAIGRHLALALQPLRDAVSDKERFRALMYQLGWNPTDLPPSYAALATVIDDATAKLDALGDPPAPEQVGDLLVSVKKAYEAIRGISTAPPGVDATAFLAEIGERLFEFLLTDYLAAALPRVYRILQILNVIEIESVPSGSGRSSFIRTKFKWQEIPKIITEPAELPARVYGWGTPALNTDRFIHHIAELLVALHFPARIERPADRLVRAYTQTGSAPTPFTSASLIAPFYYFDIGDKSYEVAIALRALAAVSGKLPGFVIEPQIPSEFPLTLQLSDEIAFRVRAGTNIGTTLGILIRPGDASIKYPFEPGKPPPSAGIGVGFDFNPTAPTVLFGASKETRLEFQGASVDFAAETKTGDLDILFRAQLKKTALVLAAGEGDSFLNSFLGSGERRIEFPLGIEWSRKGGVHFTASDGFEVALQPHQRLGPLSLDEIAFRLFAPSDHSADLSLAVGTALSGKLGPVAFSVAGMGFRVDTKFTAGNVGPFDLGLGFKPPTGVGLAIDAGVVQGGGFLSFDTEKGEYAGALFLELEGGISLSALGLINTKLPGGQPGYSLIVVVTAEGVRVHADGDWRAFGRASHDQRRGAASGGAQRFAKRRARPQGRGRQCRTVSEHIGEIFSDGERPLFFWTAGRDHLGDTGADHDQACGGVRVRRAHAPDSAGANHGDPAAAGSGPCPITDECRGRD